MKLTRPKYFTSIAACMMVVICQQLMLHRLLQADPGAAFPSSVAEIDTDLPQVVARSYVVRMTDSPARRATVIQRLNTVSKTGINVEGWEAFGVLIKEAPPANEPDSETVVPYTVDADFCKKLRKSDLALRQKGKRVRAYRKCHPNVILKASAVPSDSMFSQQWGLNNSNNNDIDGPEAWDIDTGSSTSVIAIIDTGVDYNHPDLAPNIWRNPQEIAGNGVDDDGNGVVDDIHGYNAINDSGNPFDDNMHGTHVAGIAAAATNNGVGVAGVHWRAKIIAAKFLSSTGSGSYYNAMKATRYIANLVQRGVNIRVVNNSWGSNSYWYDSALAYEITRLHDLGVVYVAAAGNSANNNDSNRNTPVDYPNANIVGVAATDSNGNLANFSNRGQSVEIGAPGVTILSTYPGNQYTNLSGTSMASPFVSGAIGLLASRYPSLTVQQLIQTTLNSATIKPGLVSYISQGRVLNVRHMLVNGASLNPTPTPIPTPTPSPSPTPYNTGGVLRSNDGTPIANAFITITVNGTTYSTRTDASGRWRIDNVIGPAIAQITIQKRGFATFTASQALSGMGSFTAVMSTTNTQLKIRVIDTEQNPVSGVALQIGPNLTMRTNGNGEIQYSVPYSSTYSVSAIPEGDAVYTGPVTGTIQGNTTRVIVQLE